DAERALRPFADGALHEHLAARLAPRTVDRRGALAQEAALRLRDLRLAERTRDLSGHPAVRARVLDLHLAVAADARDLGSAAQLAIDRALPRAKLARRLLTPRLPRHGSLDAIRVRAREKPLPRRHPLPLFLGDVDVASAKEARPLPLPVAAGAVVEV